MGRHSAPADDTDDDDISASALDLSPRGTGRHSRADGDLLVHDPGPAAASGAAPVDDDAVVEDTAEIPVDVVPFSDSRDTDELDVASLLDRRAARRAAKAEKVAARTRAKEERRPAKDRPDDASTARADLAAAETAVIPVVRDPDAPPDAVTEPAPVVRPESNTRADLRLLRENSAVRFQCIAAVLGSFVLYTVVMAVIGRTDVYLRWVWIPIALAGVLLGVCLDLAHRRAARGGSADPTL